MHPHGQRRIPITQILYLSLLATLFFFSCKSFELKPEAKNVQVFSVNSSLYGSIQANKGKSDSPFSKCQSFNELSSNGRHTWHDRIMSDEEKDNAKNDVINQAAGLNANLVFITESQFAQETTGTPYRCASLDTILTLQKTLDAEEKKKQDAEYERKLQEWYSKPQHWVLCVPAGNSPLPPSKLKELMSGPGFRPTVYSSQIECGDKAWMQNRFAVSLGLRCVCEYTQLDRNKVEALYGK